MDKKTIFVRNFLTNCSIGIYPKEQKKKQKVKISVSLELRKVKAKDTIESTISYENIIILLKEVKQENFLINFQKIKILKKFTQKLLNAIYLKGNKKLELLQKKLLNNRY